MDWAVEHWLDLVGWGGSALLVSSLLSAINVRFIVKLLREQHDESAFQVLEAEPDDSYLRHVLPMHAEDIAEFQPDFDPSRIGQTSGSAAYLVQYRDFSPVSSSGGAAAC